jgi:putative intracellular protease/amidase
LEEFVSPFFEFIDNGYDMTIASTKGGQPPVDPKSNLEEWQTESTTTFSKRYISSRKDSKYVSFKPSFS